jgi:hypothetical protein
VHSRLRYAADAMSDSNNVFPCNGPQRIYLPPPPVGGTFDSVPCYRIVFPRQKVPILNDNIPPEDQGADDQGYFPINAMFVAAVPCRPALCEDACLFLNEGLARWSIYLNKVIPTSTTTFPAQLTIDFEFKIACAAINDPIFTATVVVTSAKGPNNIDKIQGRIATLSGPLGTQVEAWARVRAGDGAQPVYIRLQIIADRLGGQFAGNLGRIAGGAGLPIV